MAHRLYTSLIHNSIANFAAYCIPASLDLIMDDLQAIADPQQGKVTTLSKSGKPWSEAEVNDLVNFLYKHQSQSSGGNFKATIWKGLSTHLET
jgi:cytochrome c1